MLETVGSRAAAQPRRINSPAPAAQLARTHAASPVGTSPPSSTHPFSTRSTQIPPHTVRAAWAAGAHVCTPASLVFVFGGSSDAQCRFGRTFCVAHSAIPRMWRRCGTTPRGMNPASATSWVVRSRRAWGRTRPTPINPPFCVCSAWAFPLHLLEVVTGDDVVDTRARLEHGTARHDTARAHTRNARNTRTCNTHTHTHTHTHARTRTHARTHAAGTHAHNTHT
jgi:hypothetical protein